MFTLLLPNSGVATTRCLPAVSDATDTVQGRVGCDYTVLLHIPSFLASLTDEHC